MKKLEAKTPGESSIEMREIVFPNDANPRCTIFGGKVMQLMDTACAMAAQRHCRRGVVTAAMDHVEFLSGIPIGHQIILLASVNAVGQCSLEVGVKVLSEDPLTGEQRHTSSAYLTFACLDEKGKPTAAPPLDPQTEAEKRREREGQKRMAARRARRAR